MKSISRSPLAWLIFTVLALATIALTIHLFPRAFAMVQLTVTMDRTQALQEASTVAQIFNLGPQQHQQAASFETDDTVKTFVELEAGGLTALSSMIHEQRYQPYTWQVRHFKPYDAHELLIKYTPDGKLYGFIESVPESAPGKIISAAQAQDLAEQFARNQWHLSLDNFSLLEPSKETRPNGRIDHSFVYQRTDAAIGAGFYRLRLVVTGDKVTQLNHFVQVPDDFLRRYQHMRSANEIISWIALMIILFLYMFGGIIGLVTLMRYGWVLWRLPLICGLLIAVLQLLVHINRLPLLWMSYKTSLSPLNFLLALMTHASYQFVYTALLYTIIFAAAESLTRKAFGSHPQLFHVWTVHAGNSSQIVGRTLLGYLTVPFLMLFVVVFYIIVNTYFNWWIPSQVFFEPNILATYLPWLSSLSQALSAGFMEECLFRAIPLASAALIGKKYGHKSAWIAGTFVLQALVFGAGHANYPMQPAYARLVELIIPSFIFGGLYLRYGLLPSIITHVVYDIAWMALPIFVSSTTQSLYNQIIVIVLGALPIWILLYYRIKAGTWSELPATMYNRFWQPQVSIEQLHHTDPAPKPIPLYASTQYTFLFLGIAGLVIWALITPFVSDTPPITLDRNTAQHIARQHLDTDNTLFNYPWSIVTKLSDDDHTTMQHLFVWQEGSKQNYHALLKTYLTPPHWTVRFAQFEGDLAQRAQEYKVLLDGQGTILQVHHKLPETTQGQNLGEQDARLIAHKALQDIYHIDHTTLIEIGASAQKRPARTDWKFTFADPQNYPLKLGQQRIALEIAGDELVSYKKFIFVPEEWQRNHENNMTIAAIIKQLCGLLIYLMFIIAALVSLWYFAQASDISNRFVFVSFAVFILIFLLKTINAMPRIFYAFDTCKPFNIQLYITMGSMVISALVQSAALAFTFCITRASYRYYYLAQVTSGIRVTIGICLGFITAGLLTIAQWALPSAKSMSVSYSYLNNIVPLYDLLSSTVISYISFTLLVLLAINIATQLLTHARRPYCYASCFLSTCAFVFAGAYYADNIPLMITLSAGLSILLVTSFYTVLRFDHTIIPVVTASYMVLSIVQDGFLRSPCCVPVNTVLVSAILVLLGLGWYWLLNKRPKPIK